MVSRFVLAVMLASAPQTQAPPPSPAPTARPAERPAGTTLDELVAELERGNPELLAAKREIDVRVARIAPAGALPDPVLTASSMTGFTRPPFLLSSSTPNAFRSVSFSQAFPFPGTRGLRTSVASAEADAERWNYEDTRRSLVADLKRTFLDYVLTVRARQVTSDHRVLLDHLRHVAEQQFSVGKGAQQDVVSAQLQLSLLVERELQLDEQRRSDVTELNRLLNRPTDTPMSAAPTYVAEAVPSDLASLQAAADAGDPALRRSGGLVEMNQQAVALAHKGLRPDFGIGVSAQRYTGEMPWMYGVDVTVSLPIYAARKQRPAIAEAGAALNVSEDIRESTRTKTLSAVTQAFVAAASADQIARLYADSVLPQSQLALDSSLAAYQAGTVDFLSVLTNFQAVLAAQLSRIEQEVRRDQALARLERFVGITFVK